MKRSISPLLAITFISGVFSGIADPPSPPPDDCEEMDLCNLNRGADPIIGPLQVQGAEDCWRYLNQKALSCDFEYLIKLEELKDDDGATHCDYGNSLIVPDEMTPVTIVISPCNMEETCSLISSCTIALKKDQILPFQPCEPGGINFSGCASDLVQNPCTSGDPPKAMDPADIIAYDTDITPTSCGAFKGYRRADTMTVAYEVLPDSGLIAESVLLTFQGGDGGTRQLPSTPLGAGLTYSWDGKVGEALADLGPGQYTMGMQVSPVEGQSPFAIYDFAYSENSKTIWVVDVDMLADSNNNGDLDSGDNLVELDSPGMLVGVGGASRPLWLYKPDPGTLPEGQVYLSMVSGSGLIEVRNQDTGALIYSSDKARSANLWPLVSQMNLHCVVTAPECPEQETGDVVLEYQYVNGAFQCADRVKATVVKLDLKFRNSLMSYGKLLDPLSPPRDVRIGLLLQDAVTFEAEITPDIQTPLSAFVWTGAQNGYGPEIAITFNGIGNYSEYLSVFYASILCGRITVSEVTGLGETAWMALHPQYWGSAFDLRDEAMTWASSNIEALGGGWGNGRTDAARHAYWSAIMTADWNPDDACGLATAHEKTGLDEGEPHNATVMDLENNADGRSIGASPGLSRIDMQNAVISALNDGTLTILDDLANRQEMGLLQPSNQ